MPTHATRLLLLITTLAFLQAASAAGFFIPHARSDTLFLTETPSWFNQTSDHFSPSPSGTFPQRYYEVFDHFQPPNGPVFLLICGEAPCRGIPDDYLRVLAGRFGAGIVALEHRFYGESFPAANSSSESLRLLSSKQALADLAAFRSFYQQQLLTKFGTSTNQWVSVGISYAGALSAWFRVKFPHLVSAALASSGVVEAILEFPEFDQQIAASAGPECSAALRAATLVIEEALVKNEALTKARFGADNFSDGDFFYLMADVAALAIQYGHPDELCNPLTAAHKAGADMLEACLSYMRSFFYKEMGQEPLSYGMQHLKNESVHSEFATDRCWWWQKCTEVAFFQVAPVNGSIRSHKVDLKYHLDRCKYLFGDGILPQVDATNVEYGGKQIAATKIFFTNGSQDPWRHASKDVSSEGLPAEVMQCLNCGHGTDFRGCPQIPLQPGGNSSKCERPAVVNKARSHIEKQLAGWLKVKHSEIVV
jgi:pimeloyl-ACP methyl ester carboxylesterase